MERVNKLTEEQIEQYGRQYEEFMWRMKSSADAGASDHMRSSDVMKRLITEPSEELFSEVKETIQFDLYGVKARGIEISEFEKDLIENADTWHEIRRVINVLSESTRGRL